jgi:ribonuclease P protein component
MVELFYFQPMPLTLKKKERLKSRKAIDALFQSGSSFSLFPFRVVYLFTTTGVQVGVGASKKNFKKAVDRNRVKRLTREAYRLQKEMIANTYNADKGLSVFFVYTAKEIISYQEVYQAMGKVLTKLSILKK